MSDCTLQLSRGSCVTQSGMHVKHHRVHLRQCTAGAAFAHADVLTKPTGSSELPQRCMLRVHGDWQLHLAAWGAGADELWVGNKDEWIDSVELDQACPACRPLAVAHAYHCTVQAGFITATTFDVPACQLAAQLLLASICSFCCTSCAAL